MFLAHQPIAGWRKSDFEYSCPLPPAQGLSDWAPDLPHALAERCRSLSLHPWCAGNFEFAHAAQTSMHKHAAHCRSHCPDRQALATQSAGGGTHSQCPPTSGKRRNELRCSRRILPRYDTTHSIIYATALQGCRRLKDRPRSGEWHLYPKARGTPVVPEAL